MLPLGVGREAGGVGVGGLSQSWNRVGLQLENYHLRGTMTREARQPSSYICSTAPQASCCCCGGGGGGRQGWKQGGMKIGRKAGGKREKMVGGKEREKREGGRE